MRRLLGEIIGKISPATPEASLARDRDKLLGHEHGPYIWVAAPNTPSFVFGAGSGLYPLLLARLNPGCPVCVIEPDAAAAACFKDSLARMDLANVRVLNSVARGMEALTDGSERLGVVGVTQDHADAEFLRALRASRPMRVLFGEYLESRVDSLTLHEISRQVADHFHWRNRTDTGTVAGRRTIGPLLSVVVPVYEVARFLNRCLRSLSEQPLESMEVIVVDDGSRDGSGKICDRWAAADSRFRVIHQTNAGCAAARNAGLRAATGVYVGFVDGDDWVHPRMFPTLLSAAVTTGSDLAQCGYQEVFAPEDIDAITGEDWPESRSISRPSVPRIVDPRTMLASRPTIWRRIYRREYLKAHGIEFATALRRFDDLPFQFVTLALANRMSVIDDPCYGYRQQRPGQDIAINDERLYLHFGIFAILRVFLNEHYSPDLERQLKRVQIATHYWGSARIRRDLRRKYLQAAAHDIFTNNTSLNPVAILRLTARYSPGLLPWVLGLLPLKRHGESTWNDLVRYSD